MRWSLVPKHWFYPKSWTVSDLKYLRPLRCMQKPFHHLSLTVFGLNQLMRISLQFSTGCSGYLEASTTAADPCDFRDFSKFSTVAKFSKIVKICFWDGFGPFSAPDSNSAWKTVYIFTASDQFFNDLWKSNFFESRFFAYLLTLERYFKVKGHQNRTQHEKISPWSHSQTFWPDGMPVSARRRSLLTWVGRPNPRTPPVSPGAPPSHPGYARLFDTASLRVAK